MRFLLAPFTRSLALTRLTFRIVGRDPELLVFPLLYLLIAAPICLAATYAMADDGGAISMSLRGAGPILLAVILAVIVLNPMFGICIAHTAKTRIEGGNASLLGSLWFGLRRLHLALAWAVFSLSVGHAVGVVGRVARRVGPIGKLVLGPLDWIIGLAWRVAKLFAYPAMAYKNATPFAAVKESVGVLRRAWGETLVLEVGFEAVLHSLLFLGIVFFWPLLYVFPVHGLFVAAILYFVTLCAVFELLEAVFRTALYHYAVHGEAAMGFERGVLRSAVRRR